jgi:N utilization substance protein A
MPDSQLSLAIGKAGQNVRLAARVTGWRIDIRSESQLAGVEPKSKAVESVEPVATAAPDPELEDHPMEDEVEAVPEPEQDAAEDAAEEAGEEKE